MDDATRRWVESVAGDGAQVIDVRSLQGGRTSEMRQLQVRTAAGERTLVLRTFTLPFFLPHAESLLEREAAVLARLADSAIPVAQLVAVDARAAHCSFPSRLRTFLAGDIRLEDAGATRRSALLAELLVRIHGLPVVDGARPRTYQLWTHPRAVKIPAHATRPSEWRRALELIREQTPAYEGCFLHRDFHPGNVLFDATGSRVTGVVDWVETSWGPAELDVAHCSTALTLLHGPEAGLAFAERYLEAGGRLSTEPRIRAYWGLIDALHYAANPDKLAGPWRADLTRELLDARLERYVLELASRCG